MAMTQLMTAKELAQLPDSASRYVLIRGEFIEFPPPSYRHGKIVLWIGRRFLIYADSHGGDVTGADSGFILHLDPDTVLAPDIAYIRPDRVPPEDLQDHYSDVVPDVVVEIVSPSDRPGLQRRKIEEYLRAGVQLVVYADPRTRRLIVYRPNGVQVELTEDDTFDAGSVMPGFQLSVKKFFER